MPPIGNPDGATSRAQVPAPRSATSSDRRHGSGCGANAANITRRSRARRPSFAGELGRLVTCFVSAHAAPVVAEEARPCSTLVGLTPIPAFSHFQSPDRRSTAKMLTKDEARRIAANVAKLPELFAEGVMPTQQSRRCRVSRRCVRTASCGCRTGAHMDLREQVGCLVRRTSIASFAGVAHKQRSLAICYVRSDVG